MAGARRLPHSHGMASIDMTSEARGAMLRGGGLPPSSMKVCLLTTMQPSLNPRLVKEADTLTAAGMDVTVVYAYMMDWASRADADLFQSRSWKAVQAGGNPRDRRLSFHYTRLRYRAGREILGLVPGRLAPVNWALSRITCELIKAAKQIPADLYIAHNLGALPAAIAGARKHGARAGFDAEDFHSDMVLAADRMPVDALAAEVEAACLPECAYVTAASPAMAQAYARKYRIDRPTPILNVFPLEDRPHQFRPTNPSGPLRLYWFSQTIGKDRGLEDAIRAMGILGTPDVELYLQGQWAAGYRKEIETLAAAAGLDRRQIVHLPLEAPSEVVRRASAYDVGLALEQAKSQNRDVTITNKLFTYILAGNAVAATITAGQKPVIDRIGAAGTCYAPGDAEGLARCLDPWLRDRSALDSSRRLSWEWGTRVYNWGVDKSKFLDVIQHALARPMSHA